jgi:hypothetical protein
MRLSKQMFGYDIIYNDDLRLDGKAVRTVWSANEETIPQWFLDEVINRGWTYQVMVANNVGVECIDLL